MFNSQKEFLARLLIVVGVILGLWVLYLIQGILISLVLALLFVLFAAPLLDGMEKRKIPPILALTIFSFCVVLLLIIVVVSITPLVVREFVTLDSTLRSVIANGMSSVDEKGISGLPGMVFLQNLGLEFDMGSLKEFFSEQITGIMQAASEVLKKGVGYLFQGASSAIGALVSLGLAIVFFIFGALERNSIYRFILHISPEATAKKIVEKTPQIKELIFTWWKGQLILSLALFSGTFIGLWILTFFGVPVKNHLTLALIAGICEFIPVIGPFLAAVPAVVVVLPGGFTEAVTVIGLYIFLQQAESLFLVPRIQGKALEMGSFEVLVAMTIAGALFGVVGILFVLPVLAVAKLLYGVNNMGDPMHDTLPSTRNLRPPKKKSS